MKSKYLSYFSFIIFTLIFIGCNSESQENAEAQSIQNSSNNAVSTTAGDRTFETITDGNRLTENSMKSQLPESILGVPKSGQPLYQENDLRGGLYSRVSQTYSDSRGQSTFYLDISDYADAQNYINSVQEGLRIQNFDFSTTTQNDRGWYITESFESRGDDITARTLNVKNPRFTIELRSKPQFGTEVPSFESLMTVMGQSNLLELFDLDIPQGEDETVEAYVDNRNDLACDDLLPVERVRSFCGINGVEVRASSFEAQKNCNRRYAHPDSFGGMTFIVTQYNQSESATRAVETKLNDDDLDSESISGVGNAASMVMVGEDMFFSVAHANYLIELRSTDGIGPAGTCCVCLDQEKLVTLANDVINELP